MAQSEPASGTNSEYAMSEMPMSELGEASPVPASGGASFPPYPPYKKEPAPPSVADTIIAGRDMRVRHKSIPRQPVRPPPKPAKPKGPKATDTKLKKRAMRAHARCLRRHGAVLTDRLERMAKPQRRNVIYLWREHAYKLPPETIARLRAMLDADEPFKPDQAYEYFVNLRKTKKKTTANQKINQIKKDVLAMCADKRFVWARNATVAFARGIQHRLSRPGRYGLTDRMLRLSDIIMQDMCSYTHTKTPSRRNTHPKAKFIVEMADKIAVWIDEVLAESDDHMLMMDFDEDDEVEKSAAELDNPSANAGTGSNSPRHSQSTTPGPSPAVSAGQTPAQTPAEGVTPAPTPSQTPMETPRPSKSDVIHADEAGDAGFTDDFLNMMGGGGLLKGPQPAYLRFSGPMLEAFMILTDSMSNRGDEQLLSHGKFTQTYKEGADELKETPDFEATEYNTSLASQVNKDLTATAKPNTPSNLALPMKEIVEICSNYLAQTAEFNKDKGPAFKLLVKTMQTKGNEQLYQKEKVKRTYAKAATELEKSKGLENDHDDPNLSQEIHSTLTNLVNAVTPAELKNDMKETLDISSKYLSQCAVDEIERGPAFDLLIKELENDGSGQFTPQFDPLKQKFVAAYTLKSAPGLSSSVPNSETVPIFKKALHYAIDAATPINLKADMEGVIDRCSNYLSAFIRDRDKALQLLLKSMKENGKKELSKRNNYAMSYATAAQETETAPVLVPFLPIKDIADEVKGKLGQDMETSTPSNLKIAMKSLIQDVGRHLSQAVALRSGIAGTRYPLNLLAAIKKSLGSRPLYKYKAFGQTYAEAAEELKYAGVLESDPKCEELQHQISAEMIRGVPTKMTPTIAEELKPTMTEASKHLAKIGTEKGDALDHMVTLMKSEGENPLGQLQGYMQTYEDGARRIENANSLTNDKIDKGAYESVRGKLTDLVEKKPAPEYAKVLPGIVDDSAKFLSSPFPETESEKRQVLADLMARKGDEIVDQEGLYKLTYKEGGEEIIKAPVGVTKPQDNIKKNEILEKIDTVMPDKKVKEALKDAANEGAAHLSNIIKGRGEAMRAIHDNLKNQNDKDFLSVGKFQKNHQQTAQMLETADHFGGQKPSPVLLDKVSEKINTLPGLDKTKPHMEETADIAASYIAGVATKECGLSAKELAAMRTNHQSDAGSAKDRKGMSAVPAAVPMPVLASSGAGTVVGANEEARRYSEAAERERQKKGEGLPVPGTDSDQERTTAMGILHSQLRARGAETFYKQPHTELTHVQASDWLKKPPIKVDKTVMESSDCSRLHNKFERKLSNLVSKNTPSQMIDTMQDVVIETARTLSELFVATNYKALVKEALISEMQKRGNEILVEVDGAAETCFFAAQRLKAAQSLEVKEPCAKVAYCITKKLDDIIRCRSMARKLSSSMKEHIRVAADYLSELVTKPDDKIEAYVTLLGEMEANGDALLLEGEIPKSYKDAAAYLRQLTSYDDQINLSNSSLQSQTEQKLKGIMANVITRGYTSSVMDGVIRDSTKLLVSYVMQQGLKTDALKIMIEQMDQAGDNVLLRHGTLRKTYTDGADILRGKNTDQLRNVANVDPVVSRKIQIKLHNLMQDRTPEKYLTLIDDVIEDTTIYLAEYFLRPQFIQVCKCMKNVFVQCELWCDEILRRVARPCCTCSRHISAQALQDLAPAQRIKISPSSSKAYASGIEISMKQCPSNIVRCNRRGESVLNCPAPKRTTGCENVATTSYMLYSTVYNQQTPFDEASGYSEQSSNYSLDVQKRTSPSPNQFSDSGEISPFDSLFFDRHSSEQGPSICRQEDESEYKSEETEESADVYYTAKTSYEEPSRDSANSFWNAPTTMHVKVVPKVSGFLTKTPEAVTSTNRISTPMKSGYISRTPIVTTDQMADWHAMMVSLMWNVQAWRDWIQDYINRATSYSYEANILPAESEEKWTSLQRRLATEALQWRQYNKFSRELTLRLASRYRDKQIVSPTRATVKTAVYRDCQLEMLEIIDMFYRWTHWLNAVVKETDSLQQVTGCDLPLHVLRWTHFKKKIEEYSEDWNKYNTHLKVCWERKYQYLISEWLPNRDQPGPVWVVSACGAVPSGAVAAGIFEGEVTWVARTTYKCNVLPAALHPSKQCCIVYADGELHHYTKYQVMCNAEVSWVAWRAGKVGTRAVRVAKDVYVGRVQYHGSHLLGAVHPPTFRCHVVIYGRPFAFNCYELLVLENKR